MSEATAASDAVSASEPQLARDDGSYARFYLIAAILVLLAAAVLQIDQQSRVVVPGLGIALPESCWFFRWSGIGCPGCGLTRCFICLMHGEFAEAWRYNPGGFPFFLVVAGQIPFQLWQLWRLRTGRAPLRPQRLSVVLVSVMIGVLLLQWCLRLLPG